MENRKKTTDVLNKNLWVQFDSLNNPAIEWQWVEGHKGEYDNIEADLLAKKGIGSNCYQWQITNIPSSITQHKTDTEEQIKCTNLTDRSSFESTVELNNKSIDETIAETIDESCCPLCNGNFGGLVIQCVSCKKNGVILNVPNYHPTNYTSLTIPVETLPVKFVFLSQTLF